MDQILHVEALNLRHLRAWMTVVEEGSITAGARRLGVSQPALSQQLRALEDFFGSQLLERLPRGIKPTPLGRALLAEARATLSTSERLIRHAVTASGQEGGMLEIATLPNLVDGLMLDPIKQWRKLHPRISIRIKEFTQQTEMVDEFEMGLADVAIGVRPVNWSGAIMPLGWDEFIVLLPVDDPLFSAPGTISLDRLADRRWIMYGKSQGLSDYMTIACARAGFRPKEAVRTSQVSVAIELACAGLGVALVPRLNVHSKFAAHIKALTRPFAWEIAAIARSQFSGVAQEFVELIDRNLLISRPQHAISMPG